MPRLAIHADRGIVVPMTNYHSPPEPGELATCDTCTSPIIAVDTGHATVAWSHLDGDRNADHLVAYVPNDSHRCIYPPRVCYCGERFNATETGLIHNARANTWRRYCTESGGSHTNPRRTAVENPTTVSPSRLYPCKHCWRPAFATPTGWDKRLDRPTFLVRHITAHEDDETGAYCVDNHGDMTGDRAEVEGLHDYASLPVIPAGAKVKDLTTCTPADALLSLERAALSYRSRPVPFQLLASIALMKEITS